ncbi:MAG: GntR family transcriptional regulator [Anaerolineae bacterium]|jgi:DNA-binding GntR family transcriptional regulator
MNADRAYELLRDQILSLEIEPGVPIQEASLARRLGMPPGSVSQAVDRLVQEGWLERTNDAVRVTDETMAGIFRQSFEVRSVLEQLCARLAVERATEEQLSALEATMPQFEEAARRVDPQTWLQLDQRFHEMIYDASHNVFLVDVLKRLYALDMRIWYQVLNRMTDLPRVVESHRAIVQALVAGDARGAERAVTRHIQESRDLVMPQA